MPGKEEKNEVKGRYGAPHIAAEIKAGRYSVSGNTVAKYMKRMELRSKLCAEKIGNSSSRILSRGIFFRSNVDKLTKNREENNLFSSLFMQE